MHMPVHESIYILCVQVFCLLCLCMWVCTNMCMSEYHVCLYSAARFVIKTINH